METASTSTTTTTVTPKKSKKPLIIGLVILAFILLICCAVGAFLFIRNSQNQVNPNNMSCQYNGATYANGSSFKSTDGCNSCACNNGEAICTLMACNTGENPTPTPTPAPNPSVIEETLIGKLQVTDSDYFYGTTPYPDSIMTLKAADLVAMTCYDHYSTNFGTTSLQNQDQETINDSTINAFVAKFATDLKISGLSYCKTVSGRYIVEFESCTSQCGGGIGNIAYFAELKNNALVNETQIPNQLGAYFACNKSLALSKLNEFYTKCQTGDGATTVAAIYKVFLNDSNYTEITRVSY